VDRWGGCRRWLGRYCTPQFQAHPLHGRSRFFHDQGGHVDVSIKAGDDLPYCAVRGKCEKNQGQLVNLFVQQTD